MRTATLTRTTKETTIEITLNLDGKGDCEISTGIGFFDHMLTAFAVHAGLDLKLSAVGDLAVDGHHTVEDSGILLGKALAQALLEGGPVKRYGSFTIPMDECLASCHLDLSNRAFLVYHAEFRKQSVGEFDCDLGEEFFRAVAQQAGMTLHLHVLYGKNDHHKLEALFKAFGHAFAEAKIPATALLSTKGVL